MSSLKFKIPGSDEPGFLRRTRRAMEFFEAYAKKESADKIDELVDFLSGFIVDPKTKKEAEKVLWDASEEQFLELLNLVLGRGNEEEVVPLGEEESSDGG